MKKILIAPDSFKGTLSSLEICDIVKEEILDLLPTCEVVAVPIADGGEGTVDSFLTALEGEKVRVQVSDPFFQRIDSYYGLIHHGKTAIIEMAAAAGLPMVGGREDPSQATTYGVGELVKHAITSGVQNIIIGLGGSATNDGGCGLASALGVEFFNREGQSFIPVGGTLHEISRMDTTNAQRLLSGIQITAMCDVNNPLHGPNGAAYVFAPQKGADHAMVRRLDENLRIYGEFLDELFPNKKPSTLPGAGAAGGLGAGLYALLDVPLVSGIQTLLETVGFGELLSHADLVITGEGQMDRQSLGGKAVLGVSRYAKAKGIPVCVITGQALDEELVDAYQQGVSGIFTINRQALPLSQSRHHSRSNLHYTVRNLLNFILSIK